jgi:hypothetical protein
MIVDEGTRRGRIEKEWEKMGSDRMRNNVECEYRDRNRQKNRERDRELHMEDRNK